MKTKTVVPLALGAGAAVAWGATNRHRVRARLRREVGRARSSGQARVRQGQYRRGYSHPERNVPPLVLADRIRSMLGPLEHRLDLPHVHVMVEAHTAVLHGDVSTVDEVQAIEAQVAAIPGVEHVESHLHVGLLASDARPSSGRRVHTASSARRRLEEAARQAGCPADGAADAVSAVLSAFTARLPAGERRHVLAHLPADVRVLVRPLRRGRQPRPRTVDQLAALVLMWSCGLALEQGEPVTRCVLHELRALVPEEGADVSAVLPAGLRELWPTMADHG